MNTEFLNKASQKELKERYAVIMKAVWGNSQKMVDYCVKKANVFIPVNNGIAIIDKPSIETDFWFGYSDCGQGLSYDENKERVDSVRENIKDYFFEKNLKDINEHIKDIEDIIECAENEYSEYICVNRKHYSDEVIECRVIEVLNRYRGWGMGNSIEYLQQNDSTATIATYDEMVRYLNAYKYVKEQFTKRLEAYWKKYGSTKLHIGTYWVDR